MNPTQIDHIKPLDFSSFLAILQSIARFEKAKNTVLPVPYIELDLLATKTWEELNYSEQDCILICEQYAKMFSVGVTPNKNETFGDLAQKTYNTWLAGEQTVTFFTSGSTGTPKPCTHPESHLRQELIGIIPHFTSCKRALVSVPLHHLYGFTFGLLLPKALGIPLVSEVPFPQVIAKKLEKHDLIIAIPLLYDHLCLIDELDGKSIHCISGTAPMAEGTFQKMLDKGFFFLENFGSSELGVMCSRKKPDDPFTLLPQFDYSVENNSLTRTLPDNSILECPVQDNIEWLDNRHLRPKGRKDFAVQVGSVNVFPSKVRGILMKHDMVKECLVRLMRKEEGNRLKAFIIPNSYDNGSFDELKIRKSLREYMLKNLTSPEIPSSITFGKELPQNIIGKPTDW